MLRKCRVNSAHTYVLNIITDTMHNIVKRCIYTNHVTFTGSVKTHTAESTVIVSELTPLSDANQLQLCNGI